MKGAKLILLLFLLTSSIQMEAQLSKYQWKNRLLLIYTPSTTDTRFQDQKKVLDQQQAELKDRDMLVFSMVGDKELKNQLDDQDVIQLRKQHQVTKEGFQVILIGKDGGIKLRSKKTVPIADLFALIDGMPMRRAEMRRKKNKY